jgi:Protein of unknown function (DUF1552)
MVIAKKSLPRRTFLRGMGAAVALPFLESMAPAMTPLAQSQARPPLRFGGVYLPNGCVMENWTPKTADGSLEMTPVLKPLEPFRDQLTVVGNLTRAGGKNSSDHAVSSAGWLTGALAKQTEAEDIRVGISIDQVLAKHIGQDTPFPSLEFATEDFSGYVGGCVPGYSCAYMNTISWASETAGLPMEIDPRAAFERMFGRAGSPAERQVRRTQDRSILDSVLQEARSLRTKVGAPDRARLDNYLENVREIERRIQKTEARNATEVTTLNAPLGVPESFEEHMGLMFDLLVVAYQSDLTRVFTFMTGREASQRTYPALGFKETHHDISHHARQAEKMEQHTRINAYFAALFARFLEKLRNSPEADGDVLDHSLIAFGAGMSDGQAHNSYPLSFSVIGGVGGQVKGNRFIIAPEWTPIANVWLGVASMFGSRIESIGESTGAFQL